MTKIRALLAASFVLAAGPALAHPPPLGIPGFFGGLLHPAFTTAHMMATLAIGLLIGQQAPPWSRGAPAAFVVALIAGLASLTTGIVPQRAGEGVLLLALVCGGMVALGRALPEAAGYVLAVAAGAAIGLDSPPEVLSVRDANLMLIGTALGGTVLLVFVVEIATRLTHPWQRIGARILGSWIAASAILVLALRFAA